MKKVSANTFRNRIAEHFEELELDVICHQKRSGYAIYGDKGHQPLAKLCPTGTADEVEVYSWEDGRWRRVDDVAPVLPLNEALDYITEDLDEMFFEDEEEASVPSRGRAVVAAEVRECCGRVLLYSMMGGATGGLFWSPVAGAVWGAVVAVLGCAGIGRLVRGRLKHAMLGMVALGVPAGISAATGGALAANVHAALGGGGGRLLCAIMAGTLFSLSIYFTPLFAWLLGLFAGVVVGLQLVDILSVTNETLRYVLVAVVAAGGTKACGFVSHSFSHLYNRWISEEKQAR